MKAAIASKFAGLKSNSTTDTGAGAGAGAGSGTLTKGDADAEKAKLMKAEAAKTAIAEARARVAARSGSGSGSTTSGATATTSTPGVDSPATAPPKVKKASRVVTVIKLKKTAQGEDKIPLSSRIYVSIRSPIFPQLDDKSVYVDKTWTVGRALDKIVEWLKVTVPKNEPFDAQKRFSIFHAKELGNTPAVLNMQDRLQQASQVESGDVFYLAPADWAWSTESH
ncbi:hypothetical protein BGZ99_010076 [Dissophora globulifera]|uniref:ZFAND1-like ubiquitin-like domain-containing protein n=1 Tax=Dissophora globulifera TaxID=979702 RepID=A0A9P6UML9_9FUNG|nr:hypothetical protein BGZ99_010076 [Dissophora globulifera]